MNQSRKIPTRFAWQSGYAAFSVGHSNLDVVRSYIDRQEKRHHRQSYQDELREFFAKHHIEWDERYVWD